MKAPEVGDIVYESYFPIRCGKVIKIIDTDPHPAFYNLLVKRLNGEEIRISRYEYLEDLVADHERKLAGHKKRLEECRRL